MRRRAPIAALVILIGAANLAAADEPEAQPLSKDVRVIDQDGKPVAALRVVAWAIRTGRGHGGWSKQGYGHSEPPERTTDDDGRVSIPFPKFADVDGRVPCSALTLSVSHPDFVESVYNDVPVGETELHILSTITLSPGDLIDVAALDGVDPLPIDHVYVQWSSESYAGKTTITDESMRRLPRLPEGPELLRVVYLPDEGEPLFSKVDPLELTNGKRRRLRVQLDPGAHVSGRLDDSVPRPVIGGVIVGEVTHFVSNVGDESRDEELAWRTTATVSEDGTFTLPPIPEGDLQLIGMCEGFIAKSGDAPAFAPEHQRNRPAGSFCYPQVFPIMRGDNPEITLQMTPTASCEFHVVDPQGQPLAGVDVHFWPNVSWWRGGSQIYCWPVSGSLEALRAPDAKPWLERKNQPFVGTTDDQGVAILKTLPVNQAEYVIGNEKWELWTDETRRSSGRAELKPGQCARVDATMQPRKVPAPQAP